MAEISFVLPALNEGRSIGQVIDRIPRNELLRHGYGVSVWVLDGMSTDQTVSVARAKGAEVYVQNGRGKGMAVAQGFAFLRSDYVVMLDADNTYDPRDMLMMMDLLEDGHDVVMGSRMRGQMEHGAMSVRNRLGNRLLSIVASMLYARNVSDLCTGFWGFKGSAVKQLRLDAKGFEIEAQLYSRCMKSGLVIGEVPISYGRRCGDETKLRGLSSGIRILWALLLERVRRTGREGGSGPRDVARVASVARGAPARAPFREPE